MTDVGAGRYIHEQPDWPTFRWDAHVLANRLAAVRHMQGLFQGRMASLGFSQREGATLEALTDEVRTSSEIEGEYLDRRSVRSSIARRLGMDVGSAEPADSRTEGAVDIVLDATRHSDAPLTTERLFAWHAALFPMGRSGLMSIRVSAWRDDRHGPMQVMSGPIGRERVHYEAPAAARIDAEMAAFLAWFEGSDAVDPVLKAAVAHLWFVIIHPFEDGNGRTGRAIMDMALARSSGPSPLFYSISAQILKEQAGYYSSLEEAGKRGMDITPWLLWFLNCLERALQGAEGAVGAVLERTRFWDSIVDVEINERQRIMLNRLLDGFEGKLTTAKWSKIAKCSHDTALRDIQDLIGKGVLRTEPAGGRSTSYALPRGEPPSG
jgi:Fic family protein